MVYWTPSQIRVVFNVIKISDYLWSWHCCDLWGWSTSPLQTEHFPPQEMFQRCERAFSCNESNSTDNIQSTQRHNQWLPLPLTKWQLPWFEHKTKHYMITAITHHQVNPQELRNPAKTITRDSRRTSENMSVLYRQHGANILFLCCLTCHKMSFKLAT